MESRKKHKVLAVLELVQRVSDTNYQIRVWIKGMGPECNDFDETVNFFFDLEVGLVEKYEEYEMTDQQRDIFKKFRDLFDEFSEDHDFGPHFDVIKWDVIVGLATDVLKAFHDHPYVVEARNAGELRWEINKDTST